VEIGAQKFDLGDLNRSLTSGGYPEVGGSYVTIGGGGLATRGHLVVGGEGHGIIERREDTRTGGAASASAAVSRFFRLGAVLTPAERVDVLPLLGVGGGGMSLTIQERSAPTFGGVLADPGRSSRMITGMFAWDASLAVHYRVNATPVVGGRSPGGLMFGLRAGYTFVPNAGSWRLEGLDEVAGGPEPKVQGAYVRLSFGGWGTRKR
jgi:hypothetical protein